MKQLALASLGVLALVIASFLFGPTRRVDAGSDHFGAIAIMSTNDMLGISANGEAWFSSSLGTGWSHQGTIAGATGDFVGLVFISTNTAVAVTDEGEAWSSSNIGASWTNVGSIATAAKVADLMLWRQTNDLFALTTNGEIWRSNSVGSNWSYEGRIPGGTTGIADGDHGVQPSSWGRIRAQLR